MIQTLSVIAGFAGRTLLTAMASNVTKQYVDTQVDAIAAQVLKKLEDNTRETLHMVDEKADESSQALRQEMDRREKASAHNVRLLELNVKLTAALTDPSLIKVAIADAEGMIRPERGNTMTALWINYARALKYDGQVEAAVKSLMRFVAAVNGGEMDRNHNYDSAIYNLACYTSLLAAQYGEPEREQMLRQAGDFLAAYLKGVGYKLAEIELAQTDPDLAALRQGPHFAEAIRH